MRRERNGLPFHYGIELIDKDYVTMIGQPLTVPSYWIRRLADKGIIPLEYREAIVVCMIEDFSFDIPDDRMLRHMAHQLLTPMMTTLDVPRSRVVFIDDLINWDALKLAIKNDELPYDRLEPSTFWNNDRMQFMIQDYKKRGNN
jgi:hypothetical protein